ncbi:MAG: SWIM zinc finger domain-containing protein, partial [Propionibacteriaceae bacterium]|nr:SWIM zinc finger domain-containing protein [Propionibacteriaceae bacterium]
DLADQAYYHRELPYDPALLGRRNPRLDDARALAVSGAVSFTDATHATVTSKPASYLVVLNENLAEASCTCPWYGRYRGTRGPCKHVLAAQLAASAGG